MNLRMCVILKKLDLTVYSGTPAVIGTQYGDIRVRKAAIPGYCAEIGEGLVPENCAYGETPSIAFQKLARALKPAEAKRKSVRILKFNRVLQFKKRA